MLILLAALLAQERTDLNPPMDTWYKVVQAAARSATSTRRGGGRRPAGATSMASKGSSRSPCAGSLTPRT
jgi:hypothetical protein